MREAGVIYVIFKGVMIRKGNFVHTPMCAFVFLRISFSQAYLSQGGIIIVSFFFLEKLWSHITLSLIIVRASFCKPIYY